MRRSIRSSESSASHQPPTRGTSRHGGRFSCLDLCIDLFQGRRVLPGRRKVCVNFSVPSEVILSPHQSRQLREFFRREVSYCFLDLAQAHDSKHPTRRVDKDDAPSRPARRWPETRVGEGRYSPLGLMSLSRRGSAPQRTGRRLFLSLRAGLDLMRVDDRFDQPRKTPLDLGAA